MTNMKQVFAVALWVSLALGCSGDEETILHDGKAALEIESAGISAETVTRAGGGYTPLASTDDEVGLFLRDDAGKYTVQNNVKYSFVEAGQPWHTATPIWLGGETAKVCAYYPHHAADPLYENAVELPMHTQLYSHLEDVSYGIEQEVDGTSAHSTLQLKLDRAYSRLALNFKRDATFPYPGTCNLTKVELINSGIITKASLNIRTGAQTSVETPGTFTYDTGAGLDITVPPYTGVGDIIKSDDDETITTNRNRSILIIPCTLNSTTGSDGTSYGLTIRLTIDSKTMTVKIPTAALSAFKAGTLYTMTISIRGTELTVGGISIQDWTQQPVGGEYVPQ